MQDSMCLRGIVSGVLLSCGAPFASAETITYNWTAIVKDVTTSASGVKADDLISGSFTLDLSVAGGAMPKTSGDGMSYGQNAFASFSTSVTGDTDVLAGSTLNTGNDWYQVVGPFSAYWLDGWMVGVNSTHDSVAGSIQWNVADYILRDPAAQSSDVVSSLDLRIAPVVANAEHLAVVFNFPGSEVFEASITSVTAVPAPASLALTGVLGLAGCARRR